MYASHMRDGLFVLAPELSTPETKCIGAPE